MKLPALAVATLAVTAFVGGPALAQVTMQPIPNPPEKAMPMKHSKKKMHKAKKMEEKPAEAAPAATPPAQ
jgi:hypothetical protein